MTTQKGYWGSMNFKSVEIIIPVHNEEEILRYSVMDMNNKLQELELDWAIHIVENGSSDETNKILQELKKEISRLKVSHLEEANYGKALKYGLTNSDADYLINFDIDYYDIPFVALAAKILSVKYDIIIASKNLLLSKDQRSLTRKLASFVFRVLLFLVFRLRVSDTHGIKAWRNTEKMQQYFSSSFPGRHTYDTEIIIRAMYEDKDVIEVPITVVERRDEVRSILSRVPRTLYELWQMQRRLRGIK